MPLEQWLTEPVPVGDTRGLDGSDSPDTNSGKEPTIEAPAIRARPTTGQETTSVTSDTRTEPAGKPTMRSARERDSVPPATTTGYGRDPRSSGSGRRSLSVGIQYPGVTLGYRRPSFSLEFKALHDNDITIIGGRYYHHLWMFESGNIYWTTDLSTVKFEGDVSSGDGISTGLAGGVEKYFGRQFSWKVDVGPYYTFLDDDETNLDEDGLEFVITTALSFHFY